MNAVLDTSLVPQQDREEILRTALWESFVRVDIDHHRPAGDISARMGISAVGSIGICSAQSTAVTVRRTARLARGDDEPVIFVGLQMTGTSLVEQHGRQSVLRPGSLAVYESIAPYTLHFGQALDQHFLRIPRSVLALPDRALRDVAATSLGSDNPLSRLAFTYFSELAVSQDLRDGVFSEAIVQPSIELLRAVVTSQLGASHLHRAAMENSLGLRITQYIRRHLPDPTLSAARIAAAHGISVRHLYTVLAQSGISLGDWVRSQRLAECRKELAGPGGRTRTIAGIARSWGFMDPTHFSKVFKQTYGITPRAWREQHHPAPSRRRGTARDARSTDGSLCGGHRSIRVRPLPRGGRTRCGLTPRMRRTRRG
ncbi:helix-turn-helix domain-containing protein [Streptomyces sp. SKN60]|uniref:AraC-like ligand-binding domain-containing protein n=1 Tax=Streptomyces sp. SKN60 TaxID=2855506 RepID=UPI0022457285|nr:helix-turn-helix domain-containing protein [Streptomyces sp. SKN60]MCX2184068.1 helix-turn-helix domain-containing protein [Streptomyces sp. SKN60]